MQPATNEAWERAQIKEKELDTPPSFEIGAEQYANGYLKGYFPYLGVDPSDLKGKSILEIGCANYPALSYCNGYAHSYIIEPMDSEHLLRRIAGCDIERFKCTAEEMEFPKVDEVWLFNVLQHTISPDAIIEKAKAAASIVRFFEPINCGVDICHLHNFTVEYFAEMFGADTVRYYPENMNIKYPFHTHECAYGVWHKEIPAIFSKGL